MALIRLNPGCLRKGLKPRPAALDSLAGSVDGPNLPATSAPWINYRGWLGYLLAWPIALHSALTMFEKLILIIATHKSQEVQQAGEQIENRDKQGHRRHHVIGFTTVYYVAGFIQN